MDLVRWDKLIQTEKDLVEYFFLLILKNDFESQHKFVENLPSKKFDVPYSYFKQMKLFIIILTHVFKKLVEDYHYILKIKKQKYYYLLITNKIYFNYHIIW